MTVFREIPCSVDGRREFRVYNGKTAAGAGRLTLSGQTVEIRIINAESEPVKDFLFRALLNVCAGLKGFAVTAPEMAAGYLARFGFEDGSVRAEDVVFGSCFR